MLELFSQAEPLLPGLALKLSKTGWHGNSSSSRKCLEMIGTYKMVGSN